jgi:hypothetical protein
MKSGSSASSSHRGRNAPRAGPGAARERGCEPRARAPRQPERPATGGSAASPARRPVRPAITTPHDGAPRRTRWTYDSDPRIKLKSEGWEVEYRFGCGRARRADRRAGTGSSGCRGAVCVLHPAETTARDPHLQGASGRRPSWDRGASDGKYLSAVLQAVAQRGRKICDMAGVREYGEGEPVGYGSERMVAL